MDARRRRQLVLVLILALGLAGGCARGQPADTPVVLLDQGRAGGQPWLLEGQRQGGQPCVSLVLVGRPTPPYRRCGVLRTPLRHLDPEAIPAGGRLLVFSPLPAGARRVRLDGIDGSIRVEPARRAPGFPARFFLVELDPDAPPVEARAFADDGRAVVT